MVAQARDITAMSNVIITRDADIGNAIAAALAHVRLEAPVAGKLVATKPNETWVAPEGRTGITQPDTLPRPPARGRGVTLDYAPEAELAALRPEIIVNRLEGAWARVFD
jgi:hypothetical protein